MNAVLWTMQALLAALFIMPCFGKMSNTREQHIADGHIKPEASIVPIRILGILEWLGCIGIVVPWLTGIIPVLTPIAGVCFCMIMVGGMVSHTLKKEYKMLPLLLSIFFLAGVVAYFRFREIM